MVVPEILVDASTEMAVFLLANSCETSYVTVRSDGSVAASSARTRTTIQEVGTQMMMAQTFDRATNRLLMVETTTVMDPLAMMHT